MSRQFFSELISQGVLRVSDGYRAKNNELGGDGPIFLRSAYLQDQGFDLAEPDRFQTTGSSNFGDKIAMAGDTVITTKGNSTGRIGFVKKNVEGAVYSPHLSYWRSLNSEVIWPRFLYYWACSHAFISQLAGLAYSTDMAPYLSLRDQMLIGISLPKPSEQREIAAILGALDDKIEVNRKASAALEAMARALYRSWFVDFDPVWAKLEGRPPAHMPPTTAALFPDSFGDNGLPLGWETIPYLDLVEIISGGTPKTSETSYWSGDIPWYSVVDAPPAGQVFVHQTEKSISVAGFQASAVKQVQYGTTIISARGTVGKLAIAGQDMVFNQSCYGLRGRAEGSDAYVYFGTERAIEHLQSMAHGSVFSTITRKTFEGLKLNRATPQVMRAFEEMSSEMLGRIHRFGLESQTLAALRDALLPRLMSGELRVGAAREIIEEVV